MSSERQIAANRANGAKSRGAVTPEGKLKSRANSARSTGPRTPEGKARSSLNALRHGLLARSIVLNSESGDMFREILTAYDEAICPEDPIERRLVETLAISDWRRQRLLCMEKDQLDMEMQRQQNAALETFAGPASPAQDPPTDVVEINQGHTLVRAFEVINGQSRTSELMNRYEHRHDRQYLRALDALHAHRAEKRKMLRDVSQQKKRRKARLGMRKLRLARKNASRPDQTN